MKVLLSAYACEPGKGSEPGVGWHWAIEVARRGHDVHVITRANNRESIEQARAHGDVPHNLTFHYFDLKPWQKFWKKGNRGVHLYTILWQWGASKVALQLHAQHQFDMVHHVTFASIRFPSFMGRLGIPFVFGPAGGGEAAPYALRRGYPLSGKLKDWLRDISNALIPFDPFMRWTYSKADQIWLRGNENRAFIPRKFEQKIRHSIGVGVDGQLPASSGGAAPSSEFRVLYVGNFLYLKGMHIGLRAFAEARRELLGRGIPATLSMVGSGPEEGSWRRLASDLEVDQNVNWLGRLKQTALPEIYAGHDVFLFPSLHDSAGMVVVEAAQVGTPTLCLNIGGPGMLVDDTRGVKIEVAAKSERQVVEEISQSLTYLGENPDKRDRLGSNARQWTHTLGWDSVVRNLYEPLESTLDRRSQALKK